MNIEEVLKRADVHVHSDFDETFDDIFTTWIVSRSKQPLMRAEQKVITEMYRA